MVLEYESLHLPQTYPSFVGNSWTAPWFAYGYGTIQGGASESLELGDPRLYLVDHPA